jgi:hypothetical protein
MLNHLFFLHSIFFIFLFSCNDKLTTMNNLEEVKYFEYYDLIKLNGINELNATKLEFPFISEQKKGDTIIIEHHIDSKNTVKSIYILTNGYFVRNFSLDMGKTSFMIDEYTDSSSSLIYSFEYDVSETNVLNSISLFNGESIKTYNLENPPSTKSAPNDINKLINSNKVISTREISFLQLKDSLHVTETFNNKKISSASYVNNFSFSNYHKSLSWWLIFVWQAYSKSLNYYEGKYDFAKVFLKSLPAQK